MSAEVSDIAAITAPILPTINRFVMTRRSSC